MKTGEQEEDEAMPRNIGKRANEDGNRDARRNDEETRRTNDMEKGKGKPDNSSRNNEIRGGKYPCEHGARFCCGGDCGSTFAKKDAGPSQDYASTNTSNPERSSTTGTAEGDRIFPDGSTGTRWTRQVPEARGERETDRSRSHGNKRKTRARKEQKKRGEDRKKDKEKEIVEKMRRKCIKEAEEK